MGLDDTTSNTGMRSFLVPKLACDGSNWITWKTQVLATLMSNKGVMRHLDGLAWKLSKIPVYTPTHVISEDEEEALEKAEKHWDEYHQWEELIWVQVSTTIPKSLLIEVQKLVTAREVWNAVCEKHEKTALTIKVDECTKWNVRMTWTYTCISKRCFECRNSSWEWKPV